MEITYEKIKPIIKKEELAGNMINLEFQANNQEQALQTVAVIMPDQDELMKNIGKQMLKQGAMNAAVNGASKGLGSIVGGLGGNLIANATNSFAGDMTTKTQDPMAMLQTDVTPEKIQQAIVTAFQGLQAFYTFNEEVNEWEYSL